MNTLRLTRANVEVRSFLSVMGSLRETRLTAVLGFLVSQFPAEFGPLLGYTFSPADEIVVEEMNAGERYDVLIRKSGESHIIEGKIDSEQNVVQLSRYVAKRNISRKPSLTVVDDGSEFRQSQLRAFQELRRKVKCLKFVTWTQVAGVCREIARKRRNFIVNSTGTVIARDLVSHLEENNMTNEAQPEIYLRDVSDIPSVKLYFRHRLYKCQAKFYNSARRNLYFAPYFTRRMAGEISEANLVPVGEGISFISRVIKAQVIEKRDVLAYLKSDKHPDPKEAADLIRTTRRREILLMTLGEPRLMFVSPVTKAKLSVKMPFGQGAMGSRSCTFDDLLAASQ